MIGIYFFNNLKPFILASIVNFLLIRLQDLINQHDTSKVQEVQFLHELKIRPELSFIMFMQKQLDVIRSVPEQTRIAYIDATGGLVKIHKKKENYSYQRILNYLMLLKV